MEKLIFAILISIVIYAMVVGLDTAMMIMGK